VFYFIFVFFFSSRRRHTRSKRDWSSDVCSSDLRCLARGDSWIFGPEALYEREGDVGNVTFPCGYTLDADGDTINLYYGAADTSVALASGSIGRLLHWLDEHGHADSN